jgi:hypothetical protein
MNTAMGNVLIMCGAMYSFVQSLGIRASLINNGDDCCLIVERGSLDRVRSSIPTFFSNLGFILDVEGVATTMEEIHFCQTHPVYNGSSFVMVRDPRVAISKDVTILRNWSQLEYSVYLSELGIAGSAAYGNMPVWSAFYRCLSRSLVPSDVSDGLRRHVRAPIDDSGLGRLSRDVDNRGAVTWQSRASFAAAFGILPSVQLAIERYYDASEPGSGILRAGFAISHIF